MERSLRLSAFAPHVNDAVARGRRPRPAVYAGLRGTDGSMGGGLNGDGIVDGGDVALLLSEWSA